MTTGNTTLLGLALPVDGELDGTWGNAVNTQITSLLDSAVAGTTTLSADADVTLTNTVLAANQARQAVILWNATSAVVRNITAPAQSKPYIVINAGTNSVVLRGAGPTTGITIVSGEKCVAAWNGADFVKVASTAVSNLTGTLPVANGGTGITSLGAGVATFLGTPSSANLAAAVTNETGSGALVFATSPTLVTPILGTPASGTLTNTTGLPIVAGTTGTLSVARGGTGLATLTANNVIIGNGTSAPLFVAPGTSGNVLTSNGTTWASTTPAASGASVGQAIAFSLIFGL